MSSREVAEAAWGSGDAHVQSTATRRPRPRAIGARGAPYLTFGFASKPSPSVPWARGLLSAFWEQGSPDLPACGLRRGSKGGPVRPVFINPSSRPSRGAKRRGTDVTRPPRGRPHQAGSRGGGEIKARGTSRGARDISHDDEDQAGTRRAPAYAVSSFPLWCKGGKHSRGVPRHQAKFAISVQRDQDHEDCKMEVIVEPKTASSSELCAGEDYFCQDS